MQPIVFRALLSTWRPHILSPSVAKIAHFSNTTKHLPFFAPQNSDKHIFLPNYILITVNDQIESKKFHSLVRNFARQSLTFA